jgi:hypothetical protein
VFVLPVLYEMANIGYRLIDRARCEQVIRVIWVDMSDKSRRVKRSKMGS